MIYILVAVFLDRGVLYVEDRNLNLQECAGRAAMARQDFQAVLPKLNGKIGRVEFHCMPQTKVTK